MENKIRPTKKQQEMLLFVADYINQHGYSPSYREIMVGLNYTSVATVALHINNLISRGHLIKRGHSARSLELSDSKKSTQLVTNQISPAEEKWLIKKIDYYFKQIEESSIKSGIEIEKLVILVETLKIFNFEKAAFSFTNRLNRLTSQLN